MSEDLRVKNFSPPSILIEGPGFSDAEFYGKWLLAAAEAQRLCNEALGTDLEFRAQTDRFDFIWHVGFNALSLMGCLAEKVRTMVITTGIELGEVVAMMAHLGFFVLTGERYQMVLPQQLNSETVRAAALKIVETEDTDFVLHPENLVATMPLETAEVWQRRLQEMDEFQRLADRKLLLGEDSVEEDASSNETVQTARHD